MEIKHVMLVLQAPCSGYRKAYVLIIVVCQVKHELIDLI